MHSLSRSEFQVNGVRTLFDFDIHKAGDHLHYFLILGLFNQLSELSSSICRSEAVWSESDNELVFVCVSICGLLKSIELFSANCGPK